jgi:hypothetical protein
VVENRITIYKGRKKDTDNSAECEVRKTGKGKIFFTPGFMPAGAGSEDAEEGGARGKGNDRSFTSGAVQA